MITADEQRTVDADDDQTNDGDMPTALSGHDITLQTQHNDPLLARMIDCLQRGELPTDDNTARRVLLTKDQFIIRDNQLLHIGIKRQKNNKTDQPIVEQICVPN